jgi:hypothetical protein
LVRVTKNAGERQPIEALEVEIPAVHHIEGAGLGPKLIQDIHVVHFAVGDAHEQGDVAMQVDQRVHFHRALALAEASPREHRQTQVDGRRVQSIGAKLEFRAERIAGVQQAGACNKDLREIGEDAPVVAFIGVGQCGSRDSAADAHVVQLVRRASQASLDISQALAIGELGEGHAQKLIPAGEAAQPVIAAVARDTPAELPIRKEGDQLREHRAAKVHASWWQPHVHALVFQIAARLKQP